MAAMEQWACMNNNNERQPTQPGFTSFAAEPLINTQD